MLEMIVGRCHVADSYREVLAYVISRLRNGRETWRAMPREQRRETMREIFRIHTANRQLYREVMG